MAGLGWWNDVLFRSIVFVCLASIMEKADEALLPAVYYEVGQTLHVSIDKLGSLTLVRSFTQASFAPVAGFLAQQYNRANIIATGAMMWAAATFFVGISTTFAQVLAPPAVIYCVLSLVKIVMKTLKTELDLTLMSCPCKILDKSDNKKPTRFLVRSEAI
jgi:MFS family permease